MRFSIHTTVTVRFSDTDAMGHCNNARFFTYMEEGRVRFFSELFPQHTGPNQFDLFPFILADIQCSFKTPAWCGETLIVGLGVTKFGHKSFEMEYEIVEQAGKRLVATGKSVLVMYDYSKKQSYPIPDELKERIKKIEGDRPSS